MQAKAAAAGCTTCCRELYMYIFFFSKKQLQALETTMGGARCFSLVW